MLAGDWMRDRESRALFAERFRALFAASGSCKAGALDDGFARSPDVGPRLKAQRLTFLCRACLGLFLLLTGAGTGSSSAIAFSIELNDVAPMRVEWQRAHARGQMPLLGTPTIKTMKLRLAERGFKAGSSIFIRIFKAESEVEIWLRKGERYELFETYPICHWSGSLGPKLAEGDKQNPEGFYSVGWRQMRRWGRWPKSINIGFPNRYDKAHGRTGSYILVHGGCSSVGCFALTNPVMEEVYKLSKAAMRNGQNRFQIHIYPFRMTAQKMAQHETDKWFSFWQNLKEGYDNFVRTRVPPRISVCGKRYLIEDAGKNEIDVLRPMKRLRMVKFSDADKNDRCVSPDPDLARVPRSEPVLQTKKSPSATAVRHAASIAAASRSANNRF